MYWEYYTHTIDVSGWFTDGEVDADKVTEELDSLGEDGWELVSSFGAGESGVTKTLVFIFKRVNYYEQEDEEARKSG